MDRQILNGFKFAFGITLFFGLLFGFVYAVGFHIAEEVLSGTFTGDFEFNGSVNFTNANVSGISSGLVSLQTYNVSSVSNLDFNLSAHSGQYSSFRIDIQYLEASNTGAAISIQTSQDGSIFDSGASDYDYTGWRATAATNLEVRGSSAQTLIPISDGITSGANSALTGTIKIYRAEQNEYTHIWVTSLHYESGSNIRSYNVNGRRLETDVVRQIRIYPSVGTFDVRATLYGLE